MTQKTKRTLLIVAIVLVLALLTASIWLAVRLFGGNHKHTPVLIAAKEATCTEDGNHAYYRCKCGDCFTDKTCKTPTTEAEQLIPATGHSTEDDGDCYTALYCSICNAVIREAGVHLVEGEKGNCTIGLKCTACGEVLREPKAYHIDNDHDFMCDNEGCQITLEGVPKDENEGIDLPLVPNNS